MRKSSQQVVFINTSPPDERVELLKPMIEIEAMPDESEEIHSANCMTTAVPLGSGIPKQFRA